MRAAGTKYDRIIAVYEQFIAAIAHIDDPVVKKLCHSWQSAKDKVEQAIATGTRSSAIASGLEQGLRELPEFVGAIAIEHRAQVRVILHDVMTAHLPEFFRQDASRLAAIAKRAKIRNEREYYLVRHRIDALEGEAGSPDELAVLYTLVEKFGAQDGPGTRCDHSCVERRRRW